MGASIVKMSEAWKPYSKEIFAKARTIVIKIGSALIVDKGTGKINRKWLSCLAQEVCQLQSAKKKVVIVSSGAVALGKSIFNLGDESLDLEQSQAAAAVGQIRLCQAYQEFFQPLNINTAQILVTAEDSENRRRYLNGKATISKLLELSIVPIVNENDTVATDEIRFGDNDRLAAQVASLAGAELLILLSDIDGIYSSDPKLKSSSEHIPVVTKVTEEIFSYAGETYSNLAKGGMKTKVEAARIASLAGCATVIAKGTLNYPISKIQAGAQVSWFLARSNPESARKQWINSIKVRGTVRIDQGADNAIKSGNSLLPAGIIEVGGKFSRGDVVEIISVVGDKIGKGISSYSSDDLDKIKGCNSDKIASKLGYAVRSALIHRDNMVL